MTAAANLPLLEENAEVLRRLEDGGSDLGPARSIDFAHVFPTRVSAEGFARDAEREGFSTSIQERGDREELPWDVTASRDMRPTAEIITAVEEQLDALARRYDGRADGWGFFGA